MGRFVVVGPEVMLQNYLTGERTKNPQGTEDEKPFSMVRYLIDLLLVDPSMKGRKDRQTARECREKFLKAKPGDIVEISEECCDRLKKLINEPSYRAAPATIMEQFDDFDTCILDAPTKREEAVRLLKMKWPELAPAEEAPPSA